MYLPARRATDWFWLAMLVAFLVLYVLVVEMNRWRKVTIPLELLVTGLFAVFNANDYLIIFPGWQVPFILGRQPKKYFYWFVSGYYAFLCAGLVRFYLVDPTVFAHWQSNDLLGLFFPFISPFLSDAFTRSMWRKRQLNQANRRLEAIVQRDERERIARDLHDTLGQSFSMITLKTELAKKLLTKAPEKVPHELDDIAQTSRENLQLVRSIVNDLHQQSLSEVLLTQSRNLATANVWLTTTGEQAASQWPTEIQGRFAAGLVEALTNVIRHAHANQVNVAFSASETNYQVVVVDDGRGGGVTRNGSNGIGGMRARMLEGHGTFQISQSGRGTRVTLTLPKGERT
ncbi:sensor histidine kinase [Lactiplantibacillus garii]|nr:sensor histidine kinase [Lactiplantibacillus garii]